MSKANIFKTVQMAKPPMNTFDLTHDVKMSGRMGWLMPVMVMDLVPGDSVNVSTDMFVRLAPMVAPVMHRIDAYCHTFFCPNRLVFPFWEDFITSQDTIAAPVLQLDGTESDLQKRFLDYMGIPPNNNVGNTQNIVALALAAYQLIYNEYYRDQNLVTEIDPELAQGSNAAKKALLTTMRLRAWEHDYFTSSLPFAQKGAAVDIPLGNIELNPDWFTDGEIPVIEDSAGPTVAGGTLEAVPVSGELGISIPLQTPLAYNPNGSLKTAATTINDLRRAFKLQEWLEKNARGGTRYIEHILAHFGVRSSDARLQRPEYLTGTKAPVVVSEVLNTSGTFDPVTEDPSSPPQGNMAGHGVVVGKGKYGTRYRAEEHGFLITIMSVRPKPAYQQGIPRHYLKTDVLDYYWPSFANIGEQEVTNVEIMAYEATSADLWGYVPRYSEYKYMPNRVAGEFRDTLSFWTLSRIFSSMPTLSQEFIEVNPDDVTRIFAVEDTADNLYIHVLNKIRARRPMPVYGTPMI